MDSLEKLEVKVQKAREAVKRAKPAVREAIDNYEKVSKKRVLKSARTKLKNAKIAYKEAKPKSALQQKASDIKESIKNTSRKIPVKKALSWTGLAITTCVTCVCGYVIYDRVVKNGESPAQDSM